MKLDETKIDEIVLALLGAWESSRTVVFGSGLTLRSWNVSVPPDISPSREAGTNRYT
jgi:hypothetical protein